MAVNRTVRDLEFCGSRDLDDATVVLVIILGSGKRFAVEIERDALCLVNLDAFGSVCEHPDGNAILGGIDSLLDRRVLAPAHDLGNCRIGPPHGPKRQRCRNRVRKVEQGDGVEVRIVLIGRPPDEFIAFASRCRLGYRIAHPNVLVAYSGSARRVELNLVLVLVGKAKLVGNVFRRILDAEIHRPQIGHVEDAVMRAVIHIVLADDLERPVLLLAENVAVGIFQQCANVIGVLVIELYGEIRKRAATTEGGVRLPRRRLGLARADDGSVSLKGKARSLPSRGRRRGKRARSIAVLHVDRIGRRCRGVVNGRGVRAAVNENVAARDLESCGVCSLHGYIRKGRATLAVSDLDRSEPAGAVFNGARADDLKAWALGDRKGRIVIGSVDRFAVKVKRYGLCTADVDGTGSVLGKIVLAPGCDFVSTRAVEIDLANGRALCSGKGGTRQREHDGAKRAERQNRRCKALAHNISSFQNRPRSYRDAAVIIQTGL